MSINRALGVMQTSLPPGGRIAQSVEQGTENPRVPSSILGPATIFLLYFIEAQWLMYEKRGCRIPYEVLQQPPLICKFLSRKRRKSEDSQFFLFRAC